MRVSKKGHENSNRIGKKHVVHLENIAYKRETDETPLPE